MKKILNGAWLFKQSTENQWMDATVPGCNFLDLMANGVIDDPFLKLNEKDVEWVGNADFEYKRTFDVSSGELSANRVLLCANMLDTVCDVFINGKFVASSDNCFIKFEFDVKDFLVDGENELLIYFHSPVNWVKDKYKACMTPMNSNGQNGIVHIRKPQCHFGWDWGPVLPCSGISDDIYLEFVNEGRIEDFSVSQVCNITDATVDAKIDYTSYKDCECRIILTSPSGEVLISDGNSAHFEIENPELWWTYDLSEKTEQPLYTVTAELLCDGCVVDECSKKIGIRKIELNRELDGYGKNFQFKINDVPIFAKGANYIPPDSFITRFGEKELNYLLDAFQFSNMNLLRIWGGGYYGSDALYYECDRRGILVWQDFMFACQAYPFFNDDFLQNVKKEVAYNVKRISSHPSLALWCGNNEIEDMHMAWINMPKYILWTEKFFWQILEPEIRKYDTQTPYTQGSPIGKAHNEGVYADNIGDTHLWGVWHGLKPMKYYRKRMTRFCSEFGFESLPDMNSIRIFADKSDYDLNSPVFLSHQKCMNGNDKMVYYIAGRFDLPVHFRDYVYLSQVTQLECIRDATEHWRRNKGRCNGSMYWQFNDCWGVCSWSSIDYYGNYKALQYGAKHFNAPLTVSFEDTDEYIKVFVLNDKLTPQEVELEYSFFDFEKGILETKSYNVTVETRASFDVPVSWLNDYDKKTTGIVASIKQNGKIVAKKTCLFDNEKHLNLPKAKLNTKIYVKNDGVELHIKTDKFARLVKAECSATHLPFSDNFFDLLPNEEKVITMKLDDSVTAKEVAENTVVYSLTDIEFNRSKINSFVKRAKLYFSPVNIGNAIHHGKVPKDEKL